MPQPSHNCRILTQPIIILSGSTLRRGFYHILRFLPTPQIDLNSMFPFKIVCIISFFSGNRSRQLIIRFGVSHIDNIAKICLQILKRVKTSSQRAPNQIQKATTSTNTSQIRNHSSWMSKKSNNKEVNQHGQLKQMKDTSICCKISKKQASRQTFYLQMIV